MSIQSQFSINSATYYQITYTYISIFYYLSITEDAAPISPSRIVLHFNGHRNLRNHSSMAASGLRPSIRSRIP